MFIVIHTSTDRAMILAMRDALSEKFPTIKFTTLDVEKRGTQVHLNGSHSEDKPNLFAEGFAAAWKHKPAEIVGVKLK